MHDLQDAFAGQASFASGSFSAKLGPVDLCTKLPQRNEVVCFYVGCNCVVLSKGQNVFDEILLETNVVARDVCSDFLKHHFAVFDTDH